MTQHRLEQPPVILTVQLQDLVPQVDLVKKPELGAGKDKYLDDLDEGVAFWMHSRVDKCPLPDGAAMPEGPADYFISHVWQLPTGPEASGGEVHAMEKVMLLKTTMQGLAAFKASRRKSRAWFLLDAEEARGDAEEDPLHMWRTWRCWVDKACARSVQYGLGQQECVHVTKAALNSCKGFLALITHSGYFSRLWCAFEWSTFLRRVAPHYRHLKLAIPEHCLQQSNWQKLVDGAASFSLQSLRTSADSQHAEIWRQLEDVFVSDEGFENFMRSTALALLALHSMLLCDILGAAFGADLVTPISEACMSIGLPGLGKALKTARPGDWWRIAYRSAKTGKEDDQFQDVDDAVVGEDEANEEKAEPEEARPEKEEKKVDEQEEKKKKNKKQEEDDLHDDPLEKLARIINAKFKRPAEKDSEEDEGSGRRQVQREECTPAQAAEYAMKLVAAGGAIRDKIMKIDERYAKEAREEQRSVAVEANEVREEQQPLAEAVPKFYSQGLSIPSAPKPPPKRPDLALNTSATFVPQLHSSEEDNQMHAQFNFTVPLGLTAFWEGVRGRDLDAEQREQVETFLKGWRSYCRRVEKWFDVHIVPHLEVWRQRSIRSPGIMHEAFGDSFLRVEGLVQEELRNKLAPGLKDSTDRFVPGHRGRPIVNPNEPWLISALERLAVVSRKQATFWPGAEPDGSDGTDDPSVDLACVPAILACSLPLQLSDEPTAAVLCVRNNHEESEWRRACVPQKLGAKALVNAVNQLLVNYSSANPDHLETYGMTLEVITPRVVLQVRGAEDCEVVCGLRISGSVQGSKDRSLKKTIEQEQEWENFEERPASSEPEPGLVVLEDENGVAWSLWGFKAQAAEDAKIATVLNDSLTSVDSLSAPRRPWTHMPRPEYLMNSPTNSTQVNSPTNSTQVSMSNTWRMGESPRMKVHKLPEADKSQTTGAFWPRQRPRTQQGLDSSSSKTRMLPAAAAPALPKLPLIKETKLWYPWPDKERGLTRSWRKGEAKVPVVADEKELSAPLAPSNWPSPPSEPRRSSLTSPASTHRSLGLSRTRLSAFQLDTQQLHGANWSWLAEIEGGPAKPLQQQDRLGTFHANFDQFYQDVRGTCFAQWVPVSAATESQERPMKSGCYNGGGGALVPGSAEFQKEDGKPGTIYDSPHPLNICPQCERCGNQSLAAVPLQGSMLEYIWEVPACVICMSCGFTDKTGQTRGVMTIEGDAVLEATTTLLLRPTKGPYVERLISRTLRLKSGQCSVALAREAEKERPTRAVSRVATVSFATQGVALCAAAAVISRSAQSLQTKRVRHRPFACDRNWIINTLADTGLDMKYNQVKQLTVDTAIEELDDKRMMPQRHEVSPLVLFAELSYLLSSDFDLIKWNLSLIEVFGKVPLPSAVIMRMNIVRLREACGAGRMKEPEAAVRQDDKAYIGKAWPITLHKVHVARQTDVEDVLNMALAGSGVTEGGLPALLQLGKDAKETYLADVEHEEAADQAKKDVDTVEVRNVLKILAKNQQAFGQNNHRAQLQARRVLKRKQVFSFLQRLQETLVQNPDDSWTRVRLSEDVPEADEEEVSSEEEDDDEEEGRMMALDIDPNDEDLHIHVPREERVYLDPKQQPEGLVIIKVLGHLKEFIQFSQMTFMAVQAMTKITATVSQFVSTAEKHFARFPVNRKGGSMNASSVIEQVMMDHGFVETALRALHRHSKHQSICQGILGLMKHLVKDDSHHCMQTRAQYELMNPPERPFTLLSCLERLSLEAQRDNLLSCLQVLVLLAQKDQDMPKPKDVMPLRIPPTRLNEAGKILVFVLGRHWRDEAIAVLLIELLCIFCIKLDFCRVLFDNNVSDEIRKFVLVIAEGKMEEHWMDEMKKRTGMKLMGPSGRGLRKLKEMNDARERVQMNVSQRQKDCWHLLWTLFRASAFHISSGHEAHERYQSDAALSLVQAVGEMKRNPRGSQWSLAAEFVKELLLFDIDSHGELFVAEDGLKLILAELPLGEVSAVLPMILASLDASKRPIPEEPPTDIRSDDEDDPQPESPASPSPSVASRRTSVSLEKRTSVKLKASPADAPPAPPAMAFGIPAEEATKTAENEDDGYAPPGAAEILTPFEKMILKNKAYMAKNGGMHGLLRSLSLATATDPDKQDGLLRAISELLQNPMAGANQAAKDFVSFRSGNAGGPKTLMNLLQSPDERQNLRRVQAVMYALTGALRLTNGVAEEIAGLKEAIKALIDIVWQYMASTEIRRRALLILRSVRVAQPRICVEMATMWEVYLKEWEKKNPVGKKAKDKEKKQKRKLKKKGTSKSMTKSSSKPSLDVKEGDGEDEVSKSIAEGSSADDHDKASSAAGSSAAEDEDRSASSSEADPKYGCIGLVADAHAEILSETIDAKKTTEEKEPKLPRGLRHFWALLKVHRFEFRRHTEAISEMVEGMKEFTDDEDLAIAGIFNIMDGAPVDLDERYPFIAQCEGFAAALKTIVQANSRSEVALSAMGLATGVLGALPAEYEEYLQVAAMSILKVLFVTPRKQWMSTSWEALLNAITTTVDRPGGKEEVVNLDVLVKLEEEWEAIRASDDTSHKMIVSGYHEMTEGLLKLME